MYRLLAVSGENRERRRQRTHPANKKPELIAEAPNAVWSWDITKLRSTVRSVYFELYVIIDIYSRYVVGWMVAAEETGELAKDFFEYYTREHRHSGIGLHTPASVHYGTATAIRRRRAEVLDAAFAANPDRFRGRRPTPPKLPTVAWINDPSREALIQNK